MEEQKDEVKEEEKTLLYKNNSTDEDLVNLDNKLQRAGNLKFRSQEGFNISEWILIEEYKNITYLRMTIYPNALIIQYNNKAENVNNILQSNECDYIKNNFLNINSDNIMSMKLSKKYMVYTELLEYINNITSK